MHGIGKFTIEGTTDVLPISLQHAAAVGWLPDHHGDPFNRLLIAQASVEAATIITRDPVIAGYDVTTAW